MSKIHKLLEKTSEVQKELHELFGFGKNAQKKLNQDSEEFLEEVYSCVDLLLSETLSYMGQHTNEKSYDKVNLFQKHGVQRIKELINEYKTKKVDKKLIIEVIEIVLKPLALIDEKSKIVDIEKDLLAMKKFILNKMGVKGYNDPVDFDATVDEPDVSPHQLAADAKRQRQHITTKNLLEVCKQILKK